MQMIKFHLLNTTKRLDRYADQLTAIGEQAVTDIKKILPVNDVDITFEYNPGFTIPEVGVCGYAPNGNLVRISLDPENPHFALNLVAELRGTLAHELHHCMRWRGPGYGTRLHEALVTEGLARSFELQFRPEGRFPVYHKVFSAENIASLLQLAKAEFDAPKYDHNQWFFTGSTAKDIPPLAGYTLGFEIVRKFLEKSGRHPGDLWNEPALVFVAE